MGEVLITHNGSLYKIKQNKDLLILDKLQKLEGFVMDTQDNCCYIPENNPNRLILKHLFLENKDLNQSINHFLDEMEMRGYSEKTIRSYKGHMLRFYGYSDKRIDELNPIDAKKYILSLIQSHNLSFSYINQAINSIKLYNKLVLSDEWQLDLPRPSKDRHLPNVLSKAEVNKIINSVTNVKHKSILYLIYGSGLRVGEVIQ